MTKRLCFLYSVLLVILWPVVTADYQCPIKCDCTEDFSVIKCREMEKFPVFDFAENVEILDLTHGKIKSIHEKQVKAYPNLEKLFINHNPLTCNERNRFVLRYLLREELGVKVFDGYKVKCKGKVQLDNSNSKGIDGNALQIKVIHATSGYQALCQERGTCMSSGQVAGAFIATFLVLFFVGGACWAVAHNRKNLSRMIEEKTKQVRPLLEAEEGRASAVSDNSRALKEGLKKQRRMSQAIPVNDIISSDEEDFVEKEQYIKEKLRKQRRRSQGFPDGMSSNDDEITVVEINLDADYQRRSSS